MDKVIELAKKAGAVSYTNRHYPDRPYRTFGPEELQKFYTLARADLEAENAKLRKQAHDLWMLLDDIDTVGDEVKSNDEMYRRLCDFIHKKRWKVMTGDEIDAARAALGETK